MRGLPALPASASLRTRRWDAVILGGALPGLAAGVVLAMRGARILVLEEAAATRRFPGLREPFVTTGAERGSVLGTCLRALGVPLIDRQRFAPVPLAYQIVLPDARLDFGEEGLAVDELVAWGLAKPESARGRLRQLAEEAKAAGEAMLEQPVLRASRLRRRPTRRGGSGWSQPAGGAPRPLEDDAAIRLALEASERTLSHLGRAEPTPMARARLRGLVLEGAPAPSGDLSLRALMVRRIESLHGEFRALDEPFAVVNASGLPGIALEESNEVLSGRLLAINAPRPALADVLAQDSIPDALRGSPVTGRRQAIHLQIEPENLPEGMAARVIRVGRTDRPPTGTNVVSLRVFPPVPGDPDADLVASAVVEPEDDPERCRARIAHEVSQLIPFSSDWLRGVDEPEPRWDSDVPLLDPAPGEAWPEACDVRISSRPLVYSVERRALAGLGSEGDLLLGWRAGEAMASDL